MSNDTDFLKIWHFSKGESMPKDCVDNIIARQLDVAIIRNIFSKCECERIVDHLDLNDLGFEITEFPAPFKSIFYGRNLNLNDPDLDNYFDAALNFHRTLEALEEACDVPILNRLQKVMELLNGGRSVIGAPGPSGRSHFFTTFRKHSPGGYIPAHFDNEQRLRPSYRYISTATQGDIFSFVVTLSEAQSGGVLEIFDLVSDNAREMRNQDGSVKPDLTNVKKQQIHVPAGSIAIVNSGTRLHRVVPVEGEISRWTICSFMARAQDNKSVYCWG
jgi:hypothetical protein